jgi:hypothetical protein
LIKTSLAHAPMNSRYVRLERSNKFN